MLGGRVKISWILVQVKMLRFKLRTLLIATAVISVFLGLQVHVHNKALRFEKEMKESSMEAQKQLIAEAGIESESDVLWKAVLSEPVSFTDVALVRRRYRIEFFCVSPGSRGAAFIHRYSIGPFGEKCESEVKPTMPASRPGPSRPLRH